MAFSLKRNHKPTDPKPPTPDNSTISLIEHLHELHNQVIKNILAILIATITSFFFYHQLFDLLTDPFRTVIKNLAENKKLDAKLTLTSIADAFTLQLKTYLITKIMIASPIWLYQIWAFIVPGLHPHKRQ